MKRRINASFVAPIFFSFIILCANYDYSSASSMRVYPTFCENASDTAQILGCKKTELDYLQGELKNVYDALLSDKSAEDAQPLVDVQNAWISYRDAECAIEEDLADGEALGRVNELSCLVSLTKKRLDRLDIYSKIDQGAMPQEHGAFPRWQNVVMDYSSAHFWNFAAGRSLDEVCPELNGHITPGLTFSDHDVDAKVDHSEDEHAQTVMALTFTKATGRPSLDVIVLSAAGGQCMTGFSLSKDDGVLSEEMSEAEPMEQDAAMSQSEKPYICAFKIEFPDPKCSNIHILKREEGFEAIMRDGAEIAVSED